MTEQDEQGYDQIKASFVNDDGDVTVVLELGSASVTLKWDEDGTEALDTILGSLDVAIEQVLIAADAAAAEREASEA